MDNQKEEILQKIEEAEYVLVGLGQDSAVIFSALQEKFHVKLLSQAHQMCIRDRPCTLFINVS